MRNMVHAICFPHLYLEGVDSDSCAAGAIAAARDEGVADALSSPFVQAWNELGRVAPSVTNHPRISLAAVTAAGAAALSYYWR